MPSSPFCECLSLDVGEGRRAAARAEGVDGGEVTAQQLAGQWRRRPGELLEAMAVGAPDERAPLDPLTGRPSASPPGGP